jgi:condensation enzyme
MPLVTKAELSLIQEFLCTMDRGETKGSFSQRYTVISGLRLTGVVDLDALQGSLDDLVTRHEILRTSLVRAGGSRYQEIHPPSPVSLLVRDLPASANETRGLRAQEFLNEVEASAFSARGCPLLRAVLGRFDDRDSVLALMTHHIASDAWSMQVLIRDLTTLYAARRRHDQGGLPSVRQYRDFADWQRKSSAGPAMHGAREYWREKLRDARIFTVPTDRDQPAEPVSPYSVYRFVIDAKLAAAAAKYARSMRCTSFIVLMAAYNVLAYQLTTVTDLVVPIYTSGRNAAQYQDTVGPFYNLLPIRTDIGGCASLREILACTRASCIEAYSHDIPFTQINAESTQLMQPGGEIGRAVAAFEMLPAAPPASTVLYDDLLFSEIRNRVLSQMVGAGTPYGLLWALDSQSSGEITGSVRFNPDQFDDRTVINWVAEYRQILHRLIVS